MMIEVFDDVFITSEYCTYIKKYDIVAIADMHIGFEGSAVEDGAYFPRTQKGTIIKRLDAIIDKYKPEEIIVCGDFKHAFHRNLRQEWKEVKEVLQFIRGICRISLIRGNHDNYLKTILQDELPLPYKIKRCDTNFIHGHREISLKDGIYVMGHEHPSVKVRDEIGAVAKFPAFLVNKKEKIIVMPAMSPLAGGNDITSGEFLCPVLNRMNTEDFEVYALHRDSLIYLGHISNLTHG